MGTDVQKINESLDTNNNNIYLNLPLAGSGITHTPPHNPFAVDIMVPSYSGMADNPDIVPSE